MSDQVCYNCIRKTECYTQLGLDKLKSGVTYEEMMGYSCGACFKNYEEAREFIYTVGDAIKELDVKTRQKIMNFIADKYGVSVYHVELELNRDMC